MIHADRHRDIAGARPLHRGQPDDERHRRSSLLAPGLDPADAVRESAARLMREYDVRAPIGARADAPAVRRQPAKGRARPRDGHRPKFLIAAQPTRGLDVGAVEFVYQRLFEHTARGGGVLLISTELDEVLSLSDRIAVIARAVESWAASTRTTRTSRRSAC